MPHSRTPAKDKYGYEVDDLKTARDEVHAWLAFAEDKSEEALRLMREVADRQDAVGKREVEIPAREMLGDMLLEMNRPGDALAEYEKALEPDPTDSTAWTAQPAPLNSRTAMRRPVPTTRSW